MAQVLGARGGAGRAGRGALGLLGQHRRNYWESTRDTTGRGADTSHCRASGTCKTSADLAAGRLLTKTFFSPRPVVVKG